MKKYTTFQKRTRFGEQIFDVVQEFIDDLESFSNETEKQVANAGLYVNPKTLEVLTEYGNNAPDGFDFYPIDKFIRLADDTQKNEPDCDATNELASSYCFIH